MRIIQLLLLISFVVFGIDPIQQNISSQAQKIDKEEITGNDISFEGFESTILFVSTSIVLADSTVDGIRQIPYDMFVDRISVCYENSGLTDSTVIDFKVYDEGFKTILGSSNYLNVKSGNGIGCLDFYPNKEISLNEDDLLRMDILKVATGLPENFIVTLYATRVSR